VQTIAHTSHDLPWVYRDCPPNYQGEIYLLLIFFLLAQSNPSTKPGQTMLNPQNIVATDPHNKTVQGLLLMSLAMLPAWAGPNAAEE